MSHLASSFFRLPVCFREHSFSRSSVIYRRVRRKPTVMQLAQPGLQPRLSEADNRISKSDRVGASSEHLSQLETKQCTAPPSPSQDSLDFISHMDVVKKIWRLRCGRCYNLKLNLNTTFMTKGVVKAISCEVKRSKADASLFEHVGRRTINLVQT